MKFRLLQYLLLAVCLGLSACSTFSSRGYVFKEIDVIGKYQAEYEQLRVPQFRTLDSVLVSGVEELTLREDGTFIHLFYGETGAEEQRVEDTWRLDSEGILHLNSGLWPQLGTNGYHDFNNGKGRYYMKVKGKEVVLDGTEVLMLVKLPRSRGVYLEHLPTGDPDSPIVVRLMKVE